MKRFGRGMLCVALMAPGAAMAAPGSGFVDILYSPSAKLDLSISNSSYGNLLDFGDNGSGFGIRGYLPAGETFALTAEYGSNSYDDTDLDVDQLRVGLGFVGPSTSGVFVEYDKLDLDDSTADGFSMHGRLAGMLSPGFQLYGDFGYLKLKDEGDADVNGPEFSVGGAFAVNPALSVVVDYRVTKLETEEYDPNDGTTYTYEFDFTDIRLGGRILF